MNRRRFLTATGAVCGLPLAGCTGTSEQDAETEAQAETETDRETETEADATTETTSSDSLEGTLTVATYDSFVDAPSSSPGPWIKEAFENRHPEVTLEWTTPEGGINHYIQRRNQNASFDADAYVGLKIPELVRVDQETDDELFERANVDALSNWSDLKSDTTFDADNRVLPVFSGYCSLVYNGYEVDGPETLEALTESAYEDKLLVQNPTSDNTGLYFLLWTVKVFGEDGYLDFWRDLLDNGVNVLDTWGEVYQAFGEGEASIITSFSNDQVFAKRSGADLKKHQVALPSGHGYSNLSGMGKFAPSDRTELTEAFFDFMLSPEAQGKLAELNVSFPVTETASVPSVFEEYAKEPAEPLMYTYDELVGNLDTWRDDWARTIAQY